jgi:hypothetical protein
MLWQHGRRRARIAAQALALSALLVSGVTTASARLPTHMVLLVNGYPNFLGDPLCFHHGTLCEQNVDGAMPSSLGYGPFDMDLVSKLYTKVPNGEGGFCWRTGGYFDYSGRSQSGAPFYFQALLKGKTCQLGPDDPATPVQNLTQFTVSFASIGYGHRAATGVGELSYSNAVGGRFTFDAIGHLVLAPPAN